MNGIKRTIRNTGMVLTVVLALSIFSIGAYLETAYAVPGDFVATVTFSKPCESGIGVGLAYDGANLWYSCCCGSSLDLHRANPQTGQVTASYDIVAGGLGALAYDASRNAIWAVADDDNVILIQLDAGKNVVGQSVKFNVGPCGLTDGLAYDGTDDTLYWSCDGSQVISHYDVNGNLLNQFNWAGQACYNSGLAIGGQLLYEGSDGCSHVWIVDKAAPGIVVYDFSTIVGGDPNFRDEDLECDSITFAAQSKHVMWSKEAYEPMRAHAFEIQFGSCGGGGLPPEICDDGVDNDGDGLVDCEDPDCANFPGCIGGTTTTTTTTSTTTTTLVGNNPPDCSGAYPSLSEIWPPNHKMVGVNILGVTDPDGDPVAVTITGITQDEPRNGLGDGNTCPDGAGVGTGTAQVRAERAGTKKVPGNGRVYEISFTASDGKGGECTGTVNVCVPHDQRPGHVCVDDGQIYNSTTCP